MNEKYNLFVDKKGEIVFKDMIYTKKKLKYILSFSKGDYLDLARFIVNSLNHNVEYILTKVFKVMEFDKKDIRKLDSAILEAIRERKTIMLERRRDLLFFSGDYLKEKRRKEQNDKTRK